MMANDNTWRGKREYEYDGHNRHPGVAVAKRSSNARKHRRVWRRLLRERIEHVADEITIIRSVHRAIARGR